MKEAAGDTKRRRKRKWAIPIGLLAIIFLCVAAPFALVRFEGPRNWMLDRGPGEWLLGEGTRLRVDGVERLDPGGAKLRGVVMSVQDSLGRWIPWARVSHLSARWDVGELLFGRYRIPSVEVESLAVHLQDGVIPQLKSSSQEEKETSGPAQAQMVSCGRFSLQHLDLWRNRERLLEGQLAFHGLEWVGGKLQTDLDTLRIEVHEASGLPGGRNLWMALSRGGVWLDSDGSMNVRNLTVEGPGLLGRGWVIGSSSDDEDREWHISLRPRSLRPADIARALDWTLPPDLEPVPEDTLSGFLSLVIHPDTLEARAELSGRWAGRPLDLKGMASRTERGWHVPELQLQRPDGGVVLEARADPSFTRGQGTLSLRNINLGGSDFPFEIEPLGATSLTGQARLSFERPEGEPWSLDYEIDLNSSRIRSWSLGELRAAGRIDASHVVVDSLSAQIAGGYLTGSATFDTPSKRFEGDIELERFPCIALTERFTDTPLAGWVSGRVHVIGEDEIWRLQGSVEGEDLLWDEISAGRLDSPEFDLFFPEITGDGDLRVQDLRTGPLHVTRGDVYFKGSARGLRLTGLAYLQENKVAWTGNLSPASPGGLEIASFRFEPPEGEAWSGDRTFRIGWGPEGVRFEDIELSSRSSWIELSGALAQGNIVEGVLEAEVDIESLLAGWSAVPDSTRGIVRLDATAVGPLRDLQVDLDFGGDSLLLLDWPLENVSGRGLWRDGKLRLEDLTMLGPWGEAEVTSLDFAPLDSLSLVISRLSPLDHEWLADVPLQAELRLWDLDLAWLAEKFSTDYVEPQALSFRTASAGGLESIIRVVRPEESIPGARYTPSLEGYGDIDALLTGTPGRPDIHVSVKGRDLGYRWSRADSLTARLALEAGSLSIEHLNWSTGDRGGEVHGTFPLVLSLAPPTLTIPSDGEGMDLQLRVPRAGMAALDPLSELLQEPRGEFSADLRFMGPVSEPVFLGSVEIRDGSLRIPLREERLQEINGVLLMDSLGVHLDGLEARLGKDGRITASGVFNTPEEMDMRFKVRKGTFFETGVYRVVGDGDIRIVAKVDSITGENRPHVLGTAVVREASILNIQPRETTGPPRPDPWIIIVEVAAPSNIQVNQANSRVQLSDGSFLVTRRDQWWNVAGSIQVQSGWYRIFNNQFVIRRGTLDFRDSGKGLEVVSDIVAETEITGVLSAEGDPVEAVTVTAQVQGPPDEMEVGLTSDPSMGREEIIELLSLGRLKGGTTGNGGATQETRAFLLNEFVGQLEQLLANESPLLQRVHVRQGEEDPVLVIQPLVSSQFNVNYAQQLSFSPTQEVTLHYRLSDFLFLKAGMLYERVQDGADSEEYNLDLKFRVEYGDRNNDDEQDP